MNSSRLLGAITSDAGGDGEANGDGDIEVNGDVDGDASGDGDAEVMAVIVRRKWQILDNVN